MAIKTIKLKNYQDVFLELLAGGTLYPGMLLLHGSNNTVVAHNDGAPANCIPMFALEDALQGKDIDDAYASGDPVRVWIPGRGDEVYAIAEDGHNYTIGTFVESNGSGYMQPFTSGKAVGYVCEAIDLSGSSGEEESESPFGFNKRIKIRII